MQRFADLENYFEILIITVIYAHSELSSWDFNKNDEQKYFKEKL